MNKPPYLDTSQHGACNATSRFNRVAQRPPIVVVAQCCLVAGLAAGWLGGVARGEAFDRRFSEATRAVVVIDDWPALRTSWKNTSWGRLAEQPDLRPLWNQAVDSAEQQWQRLFPAGVSLAELQALANGQVALAIVELGRQKPGYLLELSLAGNEAAAGELLARANRTLSGARWTSQSDRSGTHTTWTWQTSDGARQLSATLGEGRLAFATDPAILQALAVPSPEHQPLADYAPCVNTLARAAGTEQTNGNGNGEQPALRFFVAPIELMLLLEPVDPDEDPDEEYLVDKHGFRALRGLGGALRIADGDSDLTFRLAVQTADTDRGGMELLKFVPALPTDIPAWIPREVSSFAALHWSLEELLTHLGPVFDDTVGDGIEGTFEQLLDDLRAADGPGVDLEAEIFARLGPRVLVVSDYDLPVSRTSERTLLAIEAREPDELAEALTALLRDDPGAKRLRVEGFPHDVWQIGDESSQLDEREGLHFSSYGLTVAHGHLLMCSQFNGLARYLRPPGVEPPLADDTELAQHLQRVAAPDPQREFLRLFSRIDRDFFTVYELARQGQADDAESLYGNLLAQVRKSPEGDPSSSLSLQLPPFDELRPYLGISSIVGWIDDDGWMFTGRIAPAAAP